MPKQKRKETDNTKKFNKLFSELEGCDEIEQKQKILEINEVVDGMNMEEFKSVFTTELFNEMDKMIEDKKLQLGNSTWMLKHVVYLKALKNICNQDFERSSLNKRFKKMIIDEEKKKEEKNEKLLVDLSECCFLLNSLLSSELYSICVPYLIKAASKKEESEETQKEVEMSLLTLNYIDTYCSFRLKQYLKEIIEIVKHQQKHKNLSRLANQSAWRFLIDRLLYNENVEEVIVNELHFVGEATRELEELTRSLDWKKKEGVERGEEANDEFILIRWLQTLGSYFFRCKLENEEFVGFLSNVVQLYQISRDNYEEISSLCIHILEKAAERRVVKVEDLLSGGAVNTFLEEMKQPTLKKTMEFGFLRFFSKISERLKEEADGETDEAKRKALKRKIFEKMEEDGYEDYIESFQKMFDFLNKHHLPTVLSLNISDCFVNV